MIIKIKKFASDLFAEIKKDDMLSAANDLTYKIFFSAFPFAIFLMSVAGFLKLDENLMTERIINILPDIIKAHAAGFIKNISAGRSANILSFSLVISVWSASSGFRTATRSINKAYGLKDRRGLFYKFLVSAALVLIFGGIIILCFVLLIFGDNILAYIKNNITGEYNMLFGIFNILRYIISVIILFFSVILINKTALLKNKRPRLKDLACGSLFTCAAWISASALFNIYIDKFADYPAVYGSVGAVIALMLWINIMCVSLLAGSEINVVLEKKPQV